MATFVLEIGSEELPARFLAGEEAELAARFTAALQEASVEHGALRTMSTPRRAIVIIEDVNPVQQEREEEVAGPPVRVAFAADGKPTKALEGFARTNGVSVDDVYRITTEKGEYVAVRKRIGGAAVADLLAEICPAVITSLPFGKRMRWGSNTLAYARPLRWIVALLVAAILKRSGFYRYFAAMFRSRARGILTLAVCLALTLIMPLQQLMFPDLTPDANYATFFFALIVVGVFLLQFAAMYAAGQDRIKAQEETILQQQAHMALLEELQQEIRAFRHDFTNLFSGLTLQAQEGDLAGIQDFMKRTSSYFDEKLGSEIAQMDGLNNIQFYPLRSLLATKLAKMRQMRIKGVLEALRPVNGQLSMDTDDLLRALGILLDNAIEAVPKWEGQVRVVLLQEEKELYLAVANNYEQAPDLSALAKKGYTTKGSGHGTGLTSYRRIVARCRGCATRTYLKDGMFIQELHIPAA